MEPVVAYVLLCSVDAILLNISITQLLRYSVTQLFSYPKFPSETVRVITHDLNLASMCGRTRVLLLRSEKRLDRWLPSHLNSGKPENPPLVCRCTEAAGDPGEKPFSEGRLFRGKELWLAASGGLDLT